MSLKTPLTLVLLVLLLVIGSLLGWQLLTQEAPPLDAGSRGSACLDRQLESGTKLRAGQITVNVYNAGSISGLAHTTMRSLIRQGFAAGVVDNAPARSGARNVLVLDPEPKSASVRLVAHQFNGDVVIRRRADDLSDGIDVIVGDGFRGLDDKAKTTLAVQNQTDVCVPVDPTP